MTEKNIYEKSNDSDAMAYQEVDLSLSAEIAQKIGAIERECHWNAVQAILCLSDSAVYVEGFAVVMGSLAVEHGWCEDDGKIIDPTYYDKQLDPVYFSGVRYSKHDIAKIMRLWSPSSESEEEDGGPTPPFIRQQNGGYDNDDYLAAMQAAYKYAGWDEAWNDVADKLSRINKLPNFRH